jgi:D-alanyl-D-alanine carboxypeptidase/D-alanyl-D-alanine-endopeptidase (penicillin-binding protein 4)
MLKRGIPVLFIASWFSSCSSVHPFAVPEGSPGIIRQFRQLDIAHQFHTGLSIYDPQSNEWLFRYRDDNFYTPASNTKILILYTALQLLGDTIAAARYQQNADTLYVWGGGDPGVMYPDVTTSHPLVDLIRQYPGTVVISDAHFQSSRYGEGWAWDDFPYNYQCERTSIPIYGNRMWVGREGEVIRTKPEYLRSFLQIETDSISSLTRSEWGDQILYAYNPLLEKEVLTMPFPWLKNDIALAWSEATGKNVIAEDVPLHENAKVCPGSIRDTLLKIMMVESDNFIAEQLLLSATFQQLGRMNEHDGIASFKRTYFHAVPDSLYWVDGSGLSRYNLMTPRSIVQVLEMIYDLKGGEYVRQIFPAGGVSGKLKNWYSFDREHPVLFAKTGTLRHHHALSGYLYTRKGRLLIFSWMHDQYTGDPSALKSSMEKLLYFLYRNY